MDCSSKCILPGKKVDDLLSQKIVFSRFATSAGTVRYLYEDGTVVYFDLEKFLIRVVHINKTEELYDGRETILLEEAVRYQKHNFGFF